MNYPTKEKVVAYITRNNHSEILVFDHDKPWSEAGTQVPAGSIEAKESQEDAVLREVAEESGLQELLIVRKLDEYTYFREKLKQYNRRHVYLLSCQKELPDQWRHIVSGDGVDKNMTFLFYWVTLEKASNILVAELGKSLEKLR